MNIFKLTILNELNLPVVGVVDVLVIVAEVATLVVFVTVVTVVDTTLSEDFAMLAMAGIKEYTT